jgi:hypothetical protein
MRYSDVVGTQRFDSAVPRVLSVHGDVHGDRRGDHLATPRTLGALKLV